MNVAGIRARKFRVLLDANHGSGCVLGKPLLERLGCEVVMLGGERFTHPRNISELQLQLKRSLRLQDRLRAGRRNLDRG